jgi:ubiquinol oxidase
MCDTFRNNNFGTQNALKTLEILKLRPYIVQLSAYSYSLFNRTFAMIPPSFLLLVQIGLTDCLLTPSRSTTTRIWPRQSAFRAQFLSSTTKAEETSSTSKYVTSLESLLKQQKAELRDTENLLELVKEASEGTKLNLDEDSSPAISTVASILSGFDYGFVSRSEGSPSLLKPGLVVDGLGYGGPPANILSLGTKQFVRNCYAIKGEYKDEEEVVLTPKQEAAQANLEQLTLNSTEIWEREFADGPIQAPWIIKAPYFFVCFLLDIVFEGRYVPSRFVLLETVARMPYFSYISMLHLYETLGFWRRSADMKRVHFAEEINEYRHLLIMESLGGDQSWWVRFVAQHSAIVYFYVLCGLWALSPSLSYRFSELLETHAVNTYGVFLDDNEELLKELPPSLAAVEYYSFGISDPFYAEFQTSALANGREVRAAFFDAISR